ncbi:MAG TPA: hypothetical protein VF329_02610 [Gammaproteobacteria bacterium]
MALRPVAVAAVAALIVGCTDEPEPTSPATEPEAESPPPVASPQAASPQAEPPEAGEIPEMIVMERGGVIPEGIEYDRTNARFLVGSLAEGTVFEVGNDGSLTPFVMDEQLVSSVGIEVDEERNRLLVANSDSAVFQGQGPGQAMLGIYDLTTGEQTAMVDLTQALGELPEDAAFFANDVAVGDDGTAYVTDTRMNVVYSVAMDGTASVLHRFEPETQPNGIVYDDGGFLLVVAATGLHKIPVDAPDTASTVMLAEPLEGGDGMVWTDDGRLAVVSNSQSRVIALTSNDDWATAEVAAVGPFEGQGTTAAVADGDVYVVKPHFQDQEPPSIERVTFQ